jgi:hypothetical protein
MPATATISTVFAILGKSIMLEHTGFLPHLQISDAGISAKAFRDCTLNDLTNWGLFFGVVMTLVAFGPQVAAHLVPQGPYSLTSTNIFGWLSFEGIFVGLP